MSPLIIFVLIAVLLFGGAYLTKRRFGMLGLGLAGGAVLADLWGTVGGIFFASEGISLGRLSPENLALTVITLLPACLLLIRGPSYHSSVQRIGGAALFMLLALALVLDPLQSLLVVNQTGAAVYVAFVRYRELIISAGLVAAFVDIFFLKASGQPKVGSKH